MGATDTAPKAAESETPVPASPNASDHLREVRDLKRRVQVGVYSTVLGQQMLNYFVLGFSTLQILVAGAVAFGISIAAVEGAFVHGLQLRKRSAYPRVVLAELGGAYTVSEACPRVLAVLRRLLDLKATLVVTSAEEGSLMLSGVSGMSREEADALLESVTPQLWEAVRSRRPVQLEGRPRLPAQIDASGCRTVIVPVMTLHEPIGAFIAVGGTRNRDLSDAQLLSGIGVALGLSLENLRQQETILHLAYHDALTGLPNRTLFEDRLSLTLVQARRKGQAVGVMFLDLDRFKVVNDTVGHALGDRVLQGVANRLTELVREGDTVARVGGDEFTVLMPELARAEDAIEVAKRILQSLKEPWTLNGRQFTVTASIGVALCPAGAGDVDSLLSRADTAMYQAKEAGRDSYSFFGHSEGAEAAAASRRITAEG